MHTHMISYAVYHLVRTFVLILIKDNIIGHGGDRDATRIGCFQSYFGGPTFKRFGQQICALSILYLLKATFVQCQFC